MDCIHLVQDRIQYQAIVMMVRKHHIHKKTNKSMRYVTKGALTQVLSSFWLIYTGYCIYALTFIILLIMQN